MVRNRQTGTLTMGHDWGRSATPLGTEDMSFSELMEKLRCRFSGRGMEEMFQTELGCRRQDKGSLFVS